MMLPCAVTRIATAVAVMTVASGLAIGQTSKDQEPKDLGELAKAIAATIDANTLKAPGALVAFESAKSHNNIVELRYVTNELAAFSNIKKNSDRVLSVKGSYYCSESRIRYLKQGIVMREIMALADNSDHIEFWFDISVCDTLAKRDGAGVSPAP